MNRRRSLFSRSLLGAALGVTAAAGCECDPVEPPPAGNICGAGQVDGAEYAVAAEGNEVVIAVFKEDAFGCGALHSHVVQATQIGFAYDLDSAGAGEVTITVPAAGLDPDDPDLRAKYLPDDENQPLSDGDRETIRGSVAEEVKAQEFADLVFVLKDLSTIDGDGTATLVSTIAGEDSEVEVAYNAKREGDDVVISGTATIDGAPHGIPRNALGFCVKPLMDLSFAVTLTPVDAPAECDVGGGEPVVYEQQFFDDQECGTVGYNVVYNNVIGPRCTGCHGGLLPDGSGNFRGGATVPLVEWRDFRVDSFRHQGGPLFEEAHEYVNLPEDTVDELPMPPGVPSGESTGLQPELLDPTGVPADITDERGLFNAWYEAGARDAQCENDVEKTVFTRTEPRGDCADPLAVHYDTVQDIAGTPASAQEFVEGNCLYCHADGDPSQAPSAPPIGTFDEGAGLYATDHVKGAADVTSPFYVTADGSPLSFWEAGVHRTIDGSMPTGVFINSFDGDPGFEAYKAWVADGYCE